MNRELLEEALDLWRRAYGVLRHTCRPATALLEVGDVRAVADWIRSGQDSLPSALRPRAGREEAFARMLCSFPATSGNTRAFKLRSGGGRVGRRLRSRAEEQAVLLKRRALERIAGESGIEVHDELFQALCDNPGSNGDLNLVTYAFELMRRVEFQSQGISVYSLWLDLDEPVRRRLAISAVCDAESRLIQLLPRTHSEILLP